MGVIAMYDFSGGMNLRGPSTMLAENECVLMQNARPVLEGGYEKRRGSAVINTGRLLDSYAAGTVTTINGSTTVTGTGTLWTGQVGAGDYFTLDDVTFYEVSSVPGNTTIITTTAIGSTTALVAYKITRRVGGLHSAGKFSGGATAYRMWAAVGRKLWRMNGADDNTWTVARTFSQTGSRTAEVFFSEIAGFLVFSNGVASETAGTYNLSTGAVSVITEPSGFHPRMLVPHSERAFCIGDTGQPTTVRVSAPGDPSDYTTLPGTVTLTILLHRDLADPIITGMSNGRLVVFPCLNSTWAIVGRSALSFSVENIHPTIGCIAPKSIAVDSDGTFYWLSNRGVVRMRATGDLDIISGQIQPEIKYIVMDEETYGAADLSRACGMFDGRFYRLSVARRTAAGNPTTHRTWVYDTWSSRGGWMFDTMRGGPWAFRPSVAQDAVFQEAEPVPHFGHRLYGWVVRAENTNWQDEGSGYNMQVQSGFRDDGTPLQRKLVESIRVKAATTTTVASLTCRISDDGRDMESINEPTIALLNSGPVWQADETSFARSEVNLRKPVAYGSSRGVSNAQIDGTSFSVEMQNNDNLAVQVKGVELDYKHKPD